MLSLKKRPIAELIPLQLVEEPRDPVIVGSILKPVGVKGEVRVSVASGNLERFKKLRSLTIRNGGESFISAIESATPETTSVRLKLAGIDDPETAEHLRGAELVIEGGESPKLEGDLFYADDLVGMQVVGDDGADIGIVKEVLTLSHHDVWTVGGSHGELLIPAVKDFILSVDTKKRLITIRDAGRLWEGA